MTETEASASLYEQFLRDGGGGFEPFSDRHMACIVLKDLDYEAQLIAISNMLQRHKEAEATTTAQIKAVDEFARESSGLRNEHAVDEWMELVHASTYEDAAHSMAALGMIAPLLESLFYQAFQGIRTRYYSGGVIPAGHARSGMAKADQFWNCHLVYNSKAKSKFQKDVVLGIMELADAIALAPHLPGDLLSVLEAIFRYRNKMFHFGFEWPRKECENFAKDISDNGWEAWFASATSNGVPFIFYMTDKLISRSFGLVHEMLSGLGAYCRHKVS